MSKTFRYARWGLLGWEVSNADNFYLEAEHWRQATSNELRQLFASQLEAVRQEARQEAIAETWEKAIEIATAYLHFLIDQHRKLVAGEPCAFKPDRKVYLDGLIEGAGHVIHELNHEISNFKARAQASAPTQNKEEK